MAMHALLPLLPNSNPREDYVKKKPRASPHLRPVPDRVPPQRQIDRVPPRSTAFHRAIASANASARGKPTE